MSKRMPSHTARAAFPPECVDPGRRDGCRWCEFNCWPDLYDGGCILLTDPSPEGIRKNRERYVNEFRERYKLEDNRRKNVNPEYREKRRAVIKFLEKIGAYAVLWEWAEYNRKIREQADILRRSMKRKNHGEHKSC